MKRTYSSLLVVATMVSLLFTASQASAQVLGTAANFGVLAGSGVTNTGPTTVIGSVGSSPTPSVSGFPPGLVTGGTLYTAANAVTLQAQNDLTTAYVGLAGLPCGTNLTGQDLGGLTLVAGTYCFASSAQLTGTLTLDAQGNPNAQFIFQIGSTLTTASNSIVQVINNGGNSSAACNVYWQVGSSATLGTTTAFEGNILALTSITLNTGATVSGRLLARNGAVTLDTNNVAVCPACPPIILAPSTLPNGAIGAVYSQTITASGGTAPYTFTLLSGTPPPGLTLSSGGVISGTPTTAGSYTFTVKATDAVGCFGSRIYTIVINAAVCVNPTLTPSTIPAGTTGVPYGPVTITASGGTGPYTFTRTGALPPGLTMSTTTTTVVISGTPTQSGSFTFTITATDALGCSASQLYSALVGCPVITIAPLPNGAVGAAYGPATITPSGGTAPYTFAVASGSGLTLTGATLSGTPTAAGTFAVTVTDANGCQGATSLTIGANPAVGGPTLDPLGLLILIGLLAAAGVLLVKRFTM